jgi:FkbM family methyltransferase
MTNAMEDRYSTNDFARRKQPRDKVNRLRSFIAVKEFLKRVLPQPVQHTIYRFLWNPVRDAYWAALKLRYILPSGLEIQVRNRSDWTVYNEVMVAGEYDFAIDFALDRRQPGRPFHAVDLGGNVGYFTFRCADRFLRRWPDGEQLRITIVEGSPLVFAELERRVNSQPRLSPRVMLHNGLVGFREGEAYIGGNHIHYGNAISAHAEARRILMPFVDLIEILRHADEIDLLKCDIEGAEFEFIENYEDLLKKVRAAVFEFHRYGKDLQQLRRFLQAYGFLRSQVLREAPGFSIELYIRDRQCF